MNNSIGLTDFFSPELIRTNASYPSQARYFECLNQQLMALDYVEPTYLNHIVTREQLYPTGLVTPQLNIAIPHTDPEHIKKPFIAITQLASPLSFYAMGSHDEVVAVDWIFALGVTQTETQLVLLQALMGLFSQAERVKQLISLTTNTQIYHFFIQSK